MNDVVKVPEMREPLIPLSILAFDLAEAPASGWNAWLAGQGISIAFDDIGLRCISRADAKRLLDAQRQNEVRRQDQAARLEQQAVEADRLRRATIWKGVPAAALPEGIAPAQAMFAADRDARPRRESPLQHALQNSGELVYHEFPADEDES